MTLPHESHTDDPTPAGIHAAATVINDSPAASDRATASESVAPSPRDRGPDPFYTAALELAAHVEEIESRLTGMMANSPHDEGERLTDISHHAGQAVAELYAMSQHLLVPYLAGDFDRALAEKPSSTDAEQRPVLGSTPTDPVDDGSLPDDCTAARYAIPGHPGVELLGHVMECAFGGLGRDWREGRELLALFVTPAQAEALGLTITRIRKRGELSCLRSAGYDVPAPPADTQEGGAA